MRLLRVTPRHIGWEDLRFPATGINPTGPASPPTVDDTIAGLLFSSTVENTVAIIAQLPHSWEAGTTLDPHIHWQKTTSAAGGVYWQLKYRWCSIGGVMDAGWTTIGSSTPASATPDTNTADKHLITEVSDIVATGYGISDMLIMQLSRLVSDPTDDYGASARLLEFDIHYKINSVGSNNQYSKTD